MARRQSRDDRPKISAGFSSRLKEMSPREKVWAIVVLESDDSGKNQGKRQSPEERRAAVERVRKSTERKLDYIDSVLDRYGGRRLDKGTSAVGSVTIKTTAAGIRALSRSKRVKTIYEDQNTRLIG
jgi:hypothetical protein